VTRSLGPYSVSNIGLGAMPLSLEQRPSDDDGVAVIVAALEAGLTLIDTADVYCAGDHDLGHNERLIARALASWTGPRPIVATKGGLSRRGGAWEVDGAPAHLRAACERSRVALQVDRIDVYQLHSKDPKVPFEAQIEALAELRQEGKVAHVGLSNVTVEEIERAQRLVPIVSVQNRMNVLDKRALTDGVLDHCTQHGITFLPYCPVGGGGWERGAIAHNAVLKELGERYSATPLEIALAWLVTKSPVVVPIPGASKKASARSSAAAMKILLAPREVQAIDDIAPR
jgi:aryl-alcohol dehydrogenase-like predicted oxidoreductase